MKLRWRSSLLWLGISVAVAYLQLFVFGPSFFLTKRDFKDPALRKIPAPVPDLAISIAPGMKLSYFGWEFEVPWTDLDPSKTKPIGKPPRQWQVIGFYSGRHIIFAERPANYWSKVLFPPSGSYLGKAYYRWLFGADASSDYAFTRAMLEATPDQLTPYMFGGERDRLTMLLTFKSFKIAAHDAKSGIFMIDTSDFRGFQYGNPESTKSQVNDVLYSDRGGVEFRFWSCPPGRAPISQADINRVIQTAKLLDRGPAQATK
jgi:hypothetical protein